jgi:hypothetical protein
VEQTDPRRRTSARLAFADHVDYLVAGDRAPGSPKSIDYDRTGRYNPLTDTEFPLCIRLFNYRHNDFTAAMTWHEHLELWIPIDSEVSFQMGDRWVKLGAGDY